MSSEWALAVAHAARGLLGTDLGEAMVLGLLEWCEGMGINENNTTPRDAAELWFDSRVQDAADTYEGEEHMSKDKSKDNKKNGHADKAPKAPKEKKAKAEGAKEGTPWITLVSPKALDYYIRVRQDLVTKHGVLKDPWGNGLISKDQARVARGGVAAEERAKRKAEKEAKKAEKEARKAQMAKMTDEDKKAFAKVEREKKQAEKKAAAKAEREALEAQIRAELMKEMNGNKPTASA